MSKVWKKHTWWSFRELSSKPLIESWDFPKGNTTAALFLYGCYTPHTHAHIRTHCQLPWRWRDFFCLSPEKDTQHVQSGETEQWSFIRSNSSRTLLQPHHCWRCSWWLLQQWAYSCIKWWIMVNLDELRHLMLKILMDYKNSTFTLRLWVLVWKFLLLFLKECVIKIIKIVVIIY